MTPEALALLHAKAFASPRPWTASEFAHIMSSPGVFLLAEVEAFLIGRVVADEAELLTIAVPDKQRRKGIGRRLLIAFEHEAVAHGAQTAFLEVAANNKPAIGLYSGSGWREAGRRPGYYQIDTDAIDAIILAKSLID